MKRAVLATIAGIFMMVVAPVSAQDTGDFQRNQARSLVQAGNFTEAFKIYDDLTNTGSAEAALYAEATRAAIDGHDMRRAAIYAERRLNVDPNDLNTHEFVPLAYRLAGDEAEARRARDEFQSYWKSSADEKVRAKPFLMIDTFRAGPWTVSVLQCMEIGGNFGIGYIFDVWGPQAPPLPSDQLAENHRRRIVLEHNRIDQQVSSELSHKDAPLRPTLDVLSATGHATLKWFDDEPAYATIRDIVGHYVANEKNLANEPPLGGRWNQMTCRPAGS